MLNLIVIFISAIILTAGYVQEDPCRSYPGECKPKTECSSGSLQKINGKWSCPSSPNGIECCPTGSGGGYAQEEPCKSYPGVCKPTNECPQGSLAKINGQWSCPSSPNGIECCPSGGGGGGRNGASIVSAARSKIGTPYVWGGGNQDGPTNGGFDCSGLSQYAVYQGTRKVVPRTAQTQYDYGGCAAISLGSRQAGDLIFWGNGNGVYHVAIVSGYDKVVYAPEPGQKVKEGPLYNRAELKGTVRRCW